MSNSLNNHGVKKCTTSFEKKLNAESKVRKMNRVAFIMAWYDVGRYMICLMINIFIHK